MKYLIPLLLAGMLHCQDSIELYGFGVSYHSDRTKDYNEWNRGLGVGWTHFIEPDFEASFRQDFTLIAGRYLDSYREPARFLMPGVRFTWGSMESWHAWWGINAGYYVGSDWHGVGAMPSGGISYDRVGLGMTAAPGMVAWYGKFEVARW